MTADSRARALDGRDGPLGALRAFGRTLGEVVCIRGALFAVELREEVALRGRLLALAALAVAFAHLGLLLLAALVVAASWDSHRLAAIGAVAALYLGLGAAAFVRMRTELAAAPQPFASSLRELERDFAAAGRST